MREGVSEGQDRVLGISEAVSLRGTGLGWGVSPDGCERNGAAQPGQLRKKRAASRFAAAPKASKTVKGNSTAPNPLPKLMS